MIMWSRKKNNMVPLVTWCLCQLQLFLVIHSLPHHANVPLGSQRQRLPDSLVSDVDYFDKLNVETSLNNRKFVELQIKCLIYDGPCDLFGRKAKALLPSIILDNCRLCSQNQKTKLSKVVVHMQQNFPAAWRDALVKYGSSPKFITAGQAAPSVALFGNGNGRHALEENPLVAQQHLIYNSVPLPQTTIPVPVLAQPQSAVEAETASLGMERLFESSPAPDLIPVGESPTPPMSPTASPNGYDVTSSAQPPSTPVMESTIEVKPTTVQPSQI